MNALNAGEKRSFTTEFVIRWRETSVGHNICVYKFIFSGLGVSASDHSKFAKVMAENKNADDKEKYYCEMPSFRMKQPTSQDANAFELFSNRIFLT